MFGNLIVGNTLTNNGTTAGAFGPGAGVVLASFVPGGAVYNNTVVGNRIVGSGLAGVTLHSHLPGQNLNGNVIASNDIGTNNLLGDFADTATTGVYVGSVDPLRITVIGNRIHDNHNGIFAAGPVTIVRTNANVFVHVAGAGHQPHSPANPPLRLDPRPATPQEGPRSRRRPRLRGNSLDLSVRSGHAVRMTMVMVRRGRGAEVLGLPPAR